MATLPILSLNDEIVARIHLENCKILLVKTSLGLCVQWLLHGSKNSNAISSAVVTDVKTSGKLFPIRLSTDLQKTVFGSISTNTSGNEKAKHALIVCNSGIIAAVSDGEPGSVFDICHIAEKPVWAGVLKASDVMLITVISKSGFIYLGQGGERHGISWFEETLNSSVLSCCGCNDTFIFCDGFSSWACLLSLNSSRTPSLKYHKLPHVGVMKMVQHEEGSVELITCDGRKYLVPWNSLFPKGEDEGKNRPRSDTDEASSTIKETMIGIKWCSEKMEAEGLKISNLNCYIEQLNIVQTLLTYPKDVFSVNVRVEQQTTSQGLSYRAFIEFWKNNEGLELEGKWWKLCVSIPQSNGSQCVSVRLDNHSFSPSCMITVPLDEADWNQNLKSIAMECYLLFDHIETGHPLCKIPACIAKVDIIHFLTTQRILNKATLSSSSFAEVVEKLSKERQSNQPKIKPSKVSAHLCKVSTSFAPDGRNIDFIKKMFSSLGFEISLSSHGDHLRLWYHDLPLDISVCQQSDKILVTLEGTKPSVVLSVKLAIEDRVIKQKASYTKSSLPPSVLRQVRQCQRLFDFEASKATTPAAVIHLHQITSNLMSLLPL